MPGLRGWMLNTVGIDVDHQQPAQPELTAADVPAPVTTPAFTDDLKALAVSFTDDPQDRLFRAHGESPAVERRRQINSSSAADKNKCQPIAVRQWLKKLDWRKEERKSHTFASLAKREFPRTTKIYFSYQLVYGTRQSVSCIMIHIYIPR